MEINTATKLKDLLKEYPWLKEEAIKISEKFKILDSPLGKILLGKADIAELSKKSGLGTDEIIKKITELISKRNNAG